MRVNKVNVSEPVAWDIAESEEHVRSHRWSRVTEKEE
jgi:hypothetical protein